MPDTMRGNFKDANCSDCGEMGCEFKHWGPLVPKGAVGYFCGFCWTERNNAFNRGEDPKPLGVQPPGIPKEFLEKKLKVTTESGSIYKLDLTEKEQERIVFCNRRKLPFTRARVICLMTDRNLCFRPRNSNVPPDLWWTSPVVSIESI